MTFLESEKGEVVELETLEPPVWPWTYAPVFTGNPSTTDWMSYTVTYTFNAPPTPGANYVLTNIGS